MNLKLLKSKLYEEIINDFNKNKDVYMFYLSPIIFKLKTKDFSNYKYSLFSKIKNKELTTFKHYKLKKYLKKDYEKDLKTIIKIVFKSDYIDKNNKYALFHIKKILSRKTKLCYINLIYRLLTDINKIPGGAVLNFNFKENFNKVYVSAASKASNLYTYLNIASKPLFNLPKDKLTKLYYKYYDNFKNTIFKEYANNDDFINSNILIKIDIKLNQYITIDDNIINKIYIQNSIIDNEIISKKFKKSYNMLNSFNYSINIENIFEGIRDKSMIKIASINKLLYNPSDILYGNYANKTIENITFDDINIMNIITSYNELYNHIKSNNDDPNTYLSLIFRFYYNLILYDYIKLFNIKEEEYSKYQLQISIDYSEIFTNSQKQIKCINEDCKTFDNTKYYTAFIIFYLYIYNLNILNTYYINENTLFNKTSITLDDYFKNKKIIDKLITHVDYYIIETYDKLYVDEYIYDSFEQYLHLNDLIELYIYKKFIITENIIFNVKNDDKLVNYSLLLNLYIKTNIRYLNLIISKLNDKLGHLENVDNKTHKNISKYISYLNKIIGIFNIEDINLSNIPDNIDNLDNYLSIIKEEQKKQLIEKFSEYTHYKEYIQNSNYNKFIIYFDSYNKYYKFIQDIDNFLYIDKSLKTDKLDEFKLLIYNASEFLSYLPTDNMIETRQKEIINIIILRIKEFNITEIREYTDKYDLLLSNQTTNFKDLYKLYEKIIHIYWYIIFILDTNKIIKLIDISKIDKTVNFLIYTQEKFDTFNNNISKLKEKLRNETFDSEFYKLKLEIINTYNTYLYKFAMNKTIDKIKQITLDKKILQDIEEFKDKASGDEYNKVIVAYNNSIIDLNKTIIKSNDTITNMEHLEQSSNEISKEDEINQEINKKIMNYNREISKYKQPTQGGNSQLQNDKLELLLSNIYKNIKLISI
jgi:hypothetical protein